MALGLTDLSLMWILYPLGVAICVACFILEVLSERLNKKIILRRIYRCRVCCHANRKLRKVYKQIISNVRASIANPAVLKSGWQ